MKYTSTRDGSLCVTFETALCSGYAPDGGLFVPTSLPHVSQQTLKDWAALPYPELAFTMLRLFIDQDELSDDVLRVVCASAFSGFDDAANAVPVVKIGSVFVAELFHGPTFCFKDLG